MAGRSEVMLIDEMPAGREMDALVAEKVMGNKLEYGCFIDDGYADDCVTDICDCAIAESLHKEKEKFPDKCQYWRELDPLPYSTDIAAAWEVVKKLKEKGWSFRYSNNACAEYQHAAAFYQCYKAVSEDILTGKSIYKDNAYAIANTACLATGRAALKAMGVTEI
jgi:hypothetical protein